VKFNLRRASIGNEGVSIGNESDPVRRWSMQRRSFLKRSTTAVLAASGLRSSWLHALTTEDWIDLRHVVIVLPGSASAREANAARVLAEESRKRCGLDWSIGNKAQSGAVTIYAGTRASWSQLDQPVAAVASASRALPVEGFALQTGTDAHGRWIAVFGADERGLLFGVGKLLRSIVFSRQNAQVDTNLLKISSSPRYPLRGHQLGYRPKTNAYDGWSVEMWDQYIRDMAVFGTNAIELMPPRTDDLPDSPHFPLPPARMMVEMSRIADNYGLDVWVWYPAMDKDYSDPHTVEAAIQEWGDVLQTLPRVDAIFVPGGDPGGTQPKYLMALLEKQKQNLNRFHSKAQMWVSPQGFNAAWMTEFLEILKQPHTQSWLDGVVFGPQSRLSPEEFRRAVPQHYPIRFYPDITHSISCQYPVPDWDIAYALTEGREIINPRPESQADIMHLFLPQTMGFITYSEGCNDDVNKFVWSALGWNPDQSVPSVLREFSRYFIGAQHEDGFAQGLLNLERNWRGSLATNEQVDVTLAGFQDMESYANPSVIQNWRWQQALYRAYYDAYVRWRLLDETGQLVRARDVLSRVWQVGWGPLPLGIGDLPAGYPANRLDPNVLLDAAEAILNQPAIQPTGVVLRSRVTELGYALFQSIHMQLAVENYQGEAVERGANLDTLDTPVSDVPWMRRQIAAIKNIVGPEKQIQAIRELLSRTDPGPGGFYDELGNIANRPHFITGVGSAKDPDFRHSPLIEFTYPDRWGAEAPIAWKRWAGALYDAPIEMRYEGLDPQRAYRVRVVYAGSSPRLKLRLQANDHIEVHPFIARAWPPAPQEFIIPLEATSEGKLKLSWTREPGLGGNGRGCQVAEVWLMLVPNAEQK
jgi:hypothetical protein